VAGYLAAEPANHGFEVGEAHGGRYGLLAMRYGL
jgi:hypothetical protein